MNSNPILKALKSRSLGTAFGPEETASVSSHGSAQTSIPSSFQVKPGDKEVVVGGKPRWCSSTPAPEGPNNGYKKERSRKSVEEWLWDARSGDPSTSIEINNELTPKNKNEKDVPVFDLSKKDCAMAAMLSGKAPPPSSGSSSLWINCESLKTEESQKSSPGTDKARKGIPINEAFGNIDEANTAFKSFMDRFKNGSALSMVEASELMHRVESPESGYSASCPMDYLYPNLENITCDISAQSSERFWSETYSSYASNEDVDVRRKRELEDEGCILSYHESIKSFRTKAVEERSPSFGLPSCIFEQPPLFDESSAAGRTEEETDDEKSSGYIGSEERNSRTPPSRPASSLKEDSEITFISTKLYRQALGSRRRGRQNTQSSFSSCSFNSTSMSSPDASYESLLSTLMPPPPPPQAAASKLEGQQQP